MVNESTIIKTGGLTNHYGRTLNYLRLSVTDRCNFRFHYFMPEEELAALMHTTVSNRAKRWLCSREK